jgi:hypothetical protein
MPTQRIQYRLRGTVTRQILWTQVIFLLATASVETVVHAGLPCSRLGLGCEEADVSINVINLAQVHTPRRRSLRRIICNYFLKRVFIYLFLYNFPFITLLDVT